MMDYSGQSLLKFLDYAAGKGLMNKETARSKKASVSVIFEILDDNEKTDIRDLNIDEVIHRFANLEGEKFTPQSLVVYKSRLNSSIRDFIRYRDNPLAYSASKSKQKKMRLKGVKTGKLKLVQDKKSKVTEGKVKTHKKVEESSGPFDSPIFPIPIRDGQIVRIAGLPHDLTLTEAKRIAAVITALALPD